ncbi:hypothetical protein [Paenibacillus sp. MMS18-CY102]|uniref:hypothetical protein n=1 Tax=Paenibacillus sp. MMS18-CY102 TaxID=2682849 RepID=UPI0013656BBF|nr:hypothetical protein [Paenibacillus sp. MMS18-CY102]MWC29438.1 hypothetical protein [Paenibacillus sp. MMS18-CY102]
MQSCMLQARQVSQVLASHAAGVVEWSIAGVGVTCHRASAAGAGLPSQVSAPLQAAASQATGLFKRHRQHYVVVAYMRAI